MVSVIITTYNRYDLLLNAIKSVQEQTYKNFELIVVDDCSTDPRYNDLKGDFKYIRANINHKNPAISRNLGIDASIGEMICFLDDDDSWLPSKLEKQLKLTQDSNAFLSCTDAYYSDTCNIYDPSQKYAVYMTEHYKQFIKTNTGKDKLPKWIRFNFNGNHNYIITSSVMLHRSIVTRVGQFVVGGLYEKWEDWSYWLRCMEHKDFLFIDEPLIFYNDSPRQRNISRTHEQIL
jgi:glycosyltransferase involved in cell wall biosynthesis